MNIGWGLAVTLGVYVAGGISGAHINPAVTIAMMASKNMKVKTGVLYIIVQIIGGICGTIVSHAMFLGSDFFQWAVISDATRSGGPYFSEFVCTFALVLTIYGCMYKQSTRPGLIIGLLVGGFIITTSSTMFANPQVTIARIFTWAIAGVRPIDAFVFVIAQIAGALSAVGVAAFLFPLEKKT